MRHEHSRMPLSERLRQRKINVEWSPEVSDTPPDLRILQIGSRRVRREPGVRSHVTALGGRTRFVDRRRTTLDSSSSEQLPLARPLVRRQLRRSRCRRGVLDLTSQIDAAVPTASRKSNDPI